MPGIPDRRSEPYLQKNIRWGKIKYSLASWLRKMPKLFRVTRSGWRVMNAIIVQVSTILTIVEGKIRGYYSDSFNLDRIIWISPRIIEYSAKQEFPVLTFKGKVIDGNWDLLEKKFDDLDICQAIREVCLEKKVWPETVFYQRMLEWLEKGEIIWGCSNRQAFDDRCRNLEQLFHSIQQDGYKTQAELSALRGEKAASLENQEVGVCIGRFGDFLFSDGAHRTSIAKVLDLPTIPVKVAVRHTQWAEFRRQLLCYTRECGASRVQPAPHPDLDDIPHNEEYSLLFNTITQQIRPSSGPILDLGAQLGYFSHRLAEIGVDCYALEDRMPETFFLNGINHPRRRRFQIIDCPLADFAPAPGVTFEAVLIMNLLEQNMNMPDCFSALINCLSRCDFRQLFVLVAGREKGILPVSLMAMCNHLDRKNLHPLVYLKDGRILYLLV
jgi:hypothetical protein